MSLCVCEFRHTSCCDLSFTCVYMSRFQDAVSLVSLFHMVHPHSESAQEAASQQAAGLDLLKVTAHTHIGQYMVARSSFDPGIARVG